MNTESIPPPSSVSTEETHPLSVPFFLSSSSSSLKPLRDRNRTNLKRRINLSRSQVLSNDFENEDNLPTTNISNKITTIITNSQTPATPTNHTTTELYSKTISPTTPSPIHTTVTCSQVWERLASNEEHQNPILPKLPSPQTTAITTTSIFPTHISFSYDPSDEEDDDENLLNNDKSDFQYVPVSSQSKLVQFQFLTFAKQQQLDLNSDDDNEKNDAEEDSIMDQYMQEYQEEEEEQQQENRTTNKRKRSVSTTASLNDIPALPNDNEDASASASTTKPPCTKKPKIKDPNANFQRLNMRKKHFSHGKKHQFSKHKRNAFYRRTRNAGGSK